VSYLKLVPVIWLYDAVGIEYRDDYFTGKSKVKLECCFGLCGDRISAKLGRCDTIHAGSRQTRGPGRTDTFQLSTVNIVRVQNPLAPSIGAVWNMDSKFPLVCYRHGLFLGVFGL